MVTKIFKIAGQILYVVFLFIVTSVVVILSGIFVLGLNIRDHFYKLIGKKQKNNGGND